ncbi:MAG TPA: hypothetical protein VLT45_10820, partial [Kofleriaceae bacterium]|nr:hypothetical protein [Kofleriaceae bacterium]
MPCTCRPSPVVAGAIIGSPFISGSAAIAAFTSIGGGRTSVVAGTCADALPAADPLALPAEPLALAADLLALPAERPALAADLLALPAALPAPAADPL